MSQMYWWLVRAMPRASAGNTLSRKLAKVPAQRAARCSLLNWARDFSTSSWRPAFPLVDRITITSWYILILSRA